jgi:hypothetical protein
MDLPDDVGGVGGAFWPLAAAFHAGTANAGHYTTVVPRASGGWMLTDDGRTTTWRRGLAVAPAHAQLVAVLLQRVAPLATQPAAVAALPQPVHPRSERIANEHSDSDVEIAIVGPSHAEQVAALAPTGRPGLGRASARW